MPYVSSGLVFSMLGVGPALYGWTGQGTVVELSTGQAIPFASGLNSQMYFTELAYAHHCGDSIAYGNETCDEGSSTASCDSDCTAVVCGDGLVNANAGEACDASGESATCDTDCTAASCGDGTLNTTSGEACDDGGQTIACDADCTLTMCGDGEVNSAAGEECDDSGESASCDVDCTTPVCGDAVLNMSAGEECDEGGATSTCHRDCTLVESGRCGDGIVDPGEQCDDDGESADCDVDCTHATCGDGDVNQVAGEECDDNNVLPNDGCGVTCELESQGEGGMGGMGAGGTGGTGGMGPTNPEPADPFAELEDAGCSCQLPGTRSRGDAAWLALLGAAFIATRRFRGLTGG
jgi:cysteine-rich repeat protein